MQTKGQGPILQFSQKKVSFPKEGSTLGQRTKMETDENKGAKSKNPIDETKSVTKMQSKTK